MAELQSDGTGNTVEREVLEAPVSVEEAGALLGMAITKLSSQPEQWVEPPQGMHSSFAASTAVPGAELFCRLASLRALLQKANLETKALSAAPGVLAVLLKLLGVSSSIAVTSVVSNRSLSGKPLSSAHTPRSGNSMPPPMLSTPLRTIWVDCVVYCHVLSDELSGQKRVDIYGFLRKMMDLGGANPRSHKAAGGTRLAAMQVVGGMVRSPILAPRVAPWALELLTLCHKGLKSAGTNEPEYRAVCVQTARSIAIGCRCASLALRDDASSFIVRGAMEDRAILETIRLIRKAAEDRYPEVRHAATEFASVASSLLPHSSHHNSSHSGGSNSSGNNTPDSPLSSLDEVIAIALKNLDDESVGVANGWSEVLARCLCVSIEYGEQSRKAASSDHASRRNADQDLEAATPNHGGVSSSFGGSANDFVSKFKTFSESRRTVAVSAICSSVGSTLDYLVHAFVKVGGELAASRGGGSYSTGGRGPRTGLGLAISSLVQLQVTRGAIGDSLSMEQTLHTILGMVGPALEKQLLVTPSLSSSSVSDHPKMSRFGMGRHKSGADAGLARQVTNRVLRRGLSEMVTEPVQLGILRDLALFCHASHDDSTTQKRTNNRYQLQVALVEVSHLLVTLGEAAAAALDDVVLPALKACLIHVDRGVRHEAAIAVCALATAFPTKSRALIVTLLDEVESNQTMLIELLSTTPHPSTVSSLPVAPSTPSLGMPPPMPLSATKRGRFRRGASPRKGLQQPPPPSLASGASVVVSSDPSEPYQHAIHGYSLVISLLLHELPRLPGGIPTKLVDRIIMVAQKLVLSQLHETLPKINPVGACTCVRAGYCMIGGALTMGPKAIASNIATIFGIWQTTSGQTTVEQNSIYTSSTHPLTLDLELECVEATLASIVAFLSFCSELLLAVPEALNHTTLLLETFFPLLGRNGRLTAVTNGTCLDSAKALIMEAFSWLPPGSFPVVADKIFMFAAGLIVSGTEDEVASSLMPLLVNTEDQLLDASSFCRANGIGQVFGAKDMTDSLVTLTSDVAHYSEREAVMHFMAPKHRTTSIRNRKSAIDSPILDLVMSDHDATPPTPLHEVGTWREPPLPRPASKVRLMDSAIHVFAATFGLKDGHEQQSAIMMLESMLMTPRERSSRGFGVSQSLVLELDRKSKGKTDNAAVVNVTATVLACLQSLPLHEATYDHAIGIGPPWMKSAKNLFFMLLPSPSHLIRRGAAEGLALLACLGVSEDAHTLQSTILHSLDEVMQGSVPNGPKLAPESIGGARAGSLLALACIQRTTRGVANASRTRPGRSRSSNTIEEEKDNSPPTMIMMSRILPSLTPLGFEGETFLVRTYALHAFGLLVAYSSTMKTEEYAQTLQKAVEVVDHNFLSAWTSVCADFHSGREGEKFSTSVAFLCVLLRLMTFLLPQLDMVKSKDATTASRFSGMVSVILQSCSSHPMVVFEGLVFFDRLIANHHLLSPNALCISFTGEAAYSAIPVIMSVIKPDRPALFLEFENYDHLGSINANLCHRAAVMCLTQCTQNSEVVSPGTLKSFALHGHLMNMLETCCGSRSFQHMPFHRSISVSRNAERTSDPPELLEADLVDCIESVINMECSKVTSNSEKGRVLLQLLLFAKAIMTGAADKKESTDDANNGEFTLSDVTNYAISRASDDSGIVLQQATPPRWQVKCQASKIASIVFAEIVKLSRDESPSSALNKSPHFDPVEAKAHCIRQCQAANTSSTAETPGSFAIFHLEELVAAACSAATASSDQAEIRSVQNAGVQFLKQLVECFGDVRDPESASINPSGKEGNYKSVLDQYSSQIMSSVRHALISVDRSDDDLESSGVLFLSGCKTLLAIAEKGLISDPAAYKRLTRPLVPATSELALCSYDESATLRVKASTLQEDGRALLMNKITKLWALAKLRYLVDKQVVSEALVKRVFLELQKSELEIAIHSAALAIDGARILKGSGLSLIGMPLAGSLTDRHDTPHAINISMQRGLTFESIDDIDDSTKESLVLAWPALASSAVSSLMKSLDRPAPSNIEQADIKLWLDKLTPLLFSGLHDSLRVDSSKNIAEKNSLQETSVMCLHGIRALVNDGNHLSTIAAKEVGQLMLAVSRGILLPAIEAQFLSDSGANPTKHPDVAEDDEVVIEASKFLEDVCQSYVDGKINFGENNMILPSILSPFAVLQERSDMKLNPETTSIAFYEVISSCIRSIKKLLSSSNVLTDAHFNIENFVKAMIDAGITVLSLMSEATGTYADIAKGEASSLVRDCLMQYPTIVTSTDKQKIVKAAAQQGSWEAWAIVCSQLDDASGFVHSLDAIKEALSDWNDASRHLAALAAMRSVVQDSVTVNSSESIIGHVMTGVGAEIMHLLKAYGCMLAGGQISDHRTAACTDCIRIIIVAFQHMHASSSVSKQEETVVAQYDEQMISAFLSVVFESLVSLIVFNGLPNHIISGNGGVNADPVIGRICAQSIVLVARTTPLAFKASMALVGPEDRGTLEAAARAELSGYARGSREHAPVKKKINLTGFSTKQSA